jgi:hypothetical protein
MLQALGLLSVLDDLFQKVCSAVPFGSVLLYPFFESIETLRSNAAGANSPNFLGDGKSAGFEDFKVLSDGSERDA